jgi:hypothetical protein
MAPENLSHPVPDFCPALLGWDVPSKMGIGSTGAK